MKVFGREITISKTVKPEQPKEEKSFDSVFREAAQKTFQTKTIGINLGNFDYEKELNTLEKIAGYNPWIAASIRAITRNITKPILRVWDEETEKDIDKPELIALLKNPHPEFSKTRYLRFCVYMYLFYGISYAIIIRDASGKSIAIQPIPSYLIRLDPIEIQNGIYKYLLRTGKQETIIKNEDLIIWRDDEFADNYYSGTSRIKHLLFTALNKNMSDRFNNASLKAGGEIKGILRTDQKLNEDDIKLYQDVIRKNYGGADSENKWMVLGNGFDAVKTGQSNAEMGFQLLQTVTKEEVAAVFGGMPPLILGLTQSVDYANAKEQMKNFWESCMMPIGESFADQYTNGLLQKEYKTQFSYYFDYSGISALQIDLNLKLQSAQLMQYIGYDNETIASTLDLPELKNAEPVQNDLLQKSFIPGDRVKAAWRDSLKSGFLMDHNRNEVQYRKNLERYFYNWKKSFTENVNSIFGPEKKEYNNINDMINALYAYLNQNKGNQDDFLKGITTPYFSQVDAVIVKNMMNKFDLTYYSGIKAIITKNKHMQKIVEINETVNKQLYDMIQTNVKAGLEANMSPYQIGQTILEGGGTDFELASNAIFKQADKRAFTIARTETTALANDLFMHNYRENGVNKKDWLTSQDDLVRNFANGAEFDHSIMDEKTEDINNQFWVPMRDGGAEGIDYPVDMEKGSAANIINCRCTYIPN